MFWKLPHKLLNTVAALVRVRDGEDKVTTAWSQNSI
jgi:hypothetical protein